MQACTTQRWRDHSPALLVDSCRAIPCLCACLSVGSWGVCLLLLLLLCVAGSIWPLGPLHFAWLAHEREWWATNGRQQQGKAPDYR